MKLVHPRLVTKNVPGLARFYEQVLGVDAIGSEDYVGLRGRGVALVISSKRSIDLFNAGAAEAAANRSVIFDFEVDDVDKERSRLHEVVTQFVLEPTDQPRSNRSMLFRDREGNLVSFFSRVQPQFGCNSSAAIL